MKHVHYYETIMVLFHCYRTPAVSHYQTSALLSSARVKVSPAIRRIETEFCFNIATDTPLLQEEMRLLRWLLAETFEPDNFSTQSFFKSEHLVLEVGPRMNFTTAWSTNAISICHACGLKKIRRIERSRRYQLILDEHTSLSQDCQNVFFSLVHDRMTECPYPAPLQTFDSGILPEKVHIIPLLEQGRSALEKINRDMGLGFDDWDLDYYISLFVKEIKRNPTNVECFDLSQSNSEHSRHWFFRGKIIIDGIAVSETLMQLVKSTYEANRNNSIIAFSDNSSAIRGY
ncbi:MAG TPA: phosphoribosylformylglycinamidine synthase, partial [Nitrospirota bacterium]|nr:phosphoribosylformylglycinamidine synthase [Nitrospirota bacterium]